MAHPATGLDCAPPQVASATPGSTPGVVLAWLRLLVVLVARSYRSILLVFVAVALIPQAWSWTSHVVRSGSMEPSLAIGDVVIAKPFTSTSHIPVGRVMLFRPTHPTAGRGVVVHRVVENLGAGSYLTRGDNNPSNDTDPVPTRNFEAQAVLCVPFIGLPVHWLREGDYLPLTAFLLGTTLALWIAAGGRSSTRTGTGRRARPGAGTGPDPRRRLAPAVLRRTGSWATSTAAVGLTLTALLAGLPVAAQAAFTAATTNRASSWMVSKTITNPLTMSSPGTAVSGAVALSAKLTNPGGVPYSVRFQSAPAGTSAWSTLCTDISAPYQCTWLTQPVPGGRYDLRAVATSATLTWTSPVTTTTTVDNVAPTVTMTNPGTTLAGNVTFTAAAGDTGSGVDRVLFQAATSGSGTYQDLCLDTVAPFACSYDTTKLPNGSYTLRAAAVDAAGNSATSTLANRTVDNVVTTVAVNTPTAPLTGTVAISAAATSTAGIATVRLQGAPMGSGAWVDLCVDSTAPYACTYNTGTAADGTYDLRAIATDRVGRVTTSATVAAVVDNTAPRAVDVQTTNGGVSGRIDAGDTVGFTYSELMKPATLTSAWTGTPVAVTARVRDGNLVGTGARGDTLDVLRGSVAVNLGLANLRESYVANNATATFNATLSASTVTLNGVPVSRVTLTLGPQISGAVPVSVTASTVLLWSPSSAATDMAGLAVAAASATESGSSDRNF